jgi:pyruvate/2-oxoglutarate dehydrogenase complex dihydrolipoamide acyltransferase (E2) component
MKITGRVIVATSLLVVGVQAGAQAPEATTVAPSKPISTWLGLVVFPAKGQTPQQQAQDEGECYAWSKGQTGVDPMAPPPAAAQPAAAPAETPPAAGGARVRGAARGAAAGAIIGEVANDDAGKGAAIGATAGVLAGGRQSRKEQQAAAEQSAQQQQQATQQAQAADQQQLDLFKKGFAACLEPKGYTVK